MNRLTHRQALLGGLAIILAVNAIALGGVAWNRGGEDSRLRLSERELTVPYAWQGSDEDSGVSLKLDWKSAGVAEFDEDASAPLRRWGATSWLDPRKLAGLGFDLRPPSVREYEKMGWRGRQREVVAVVELDGPAYARELEQVELALRRKRAQLAAAPASDDVRRQLQSLQETRDKAQREWTRLYVVDAGLDRAQLRHSYPDRRRYALMPALVQLNWELSGGRMQPRASVSALVNEQLHLSNTLATAIAPALAADRRVYDASRQPIEVDVAFGRRLEPWVVDVRLRAPDKR